MGTINRVLDRVFVVLGAFLFALFPMFIYQYQLQLIGHVNELRWHIHKMDDSAKKSGKDVDQYIQKFIDHPDKDISRQGATMHQIQARCNKLSNALSKLQHSTLLTRPFIFLFYLQWDIFKSTAASFQAGFSFNLETCFYAFMGMFCGYLLFYVLSKLWKKPVQKSLENSDSSRNLFKKVF